MKSKVMIFENELLKNRELFSEMCSFINLNEANIPIILGWVVFSGTIQVSLHPNDNGERIMRI
jgi:hypothetical protein